MSVYWNVVLVLPITHYLKMLLNMVSAQARVIFFFFWFGIFQVFSSTVYFITNLDDVDRFREVLEGRNIHRGGEGA